jgi:hypothetical protein
MKRERSQRRCLSSCRLGKCVAPKALANLAKHLAFTRCGELNFNGVVETQIAVFESELLAGQHACFLNTSVAGPTTGFVRLRLNAKRYTMHT